MPPSPESPLLSFASLHRGRSFGPTPFSVTEELVQAFMEATGDQNPLYEDAAAARAAGFTGPVAPPGLAGVWARLAYVSGYSMPPGGFMVGQRFRLCGVVPVGAVLELEAGVEEADPADPRRRVSLACRARLGDDIVATAGIDARWGEGGTG